MWTYNYMYPTDELYHSADYYYDELYHYGVPGMKWGRRKARAVVTSARNTGSRAATRVLGEKGSATRTRRVATAKKVAKGAAVAGGVALAAYGVNKAVKRKNLNIAKKQANALRENNRIVRSDIYKNADGTYGFNLATRSGKSSISGSKIKSHDEAYKRSRSFSNDINRRVNAEASAQVHNAANDNFRTASKNVARYYKKKIRR